jgi:choline dehydrogenase-like flavoprotein
LPADFAAWAEQGCTGWAWEEVLPFFIRLEDDLDYGDRPYHGRGGPIPIGRTPAERWGAVSRVFLEEALDFGHPWCEDVNAPDESRGVSPLPLNARSGPLIVSSDLVQEADIPASSLLCILKA